MKKIKINPNNFFRVLASTDRSQVAEMVLKKGQSTGGPNNNHLESDQWLFIISGKGEITIEGKIINTQKNDLILIEAGENHEVKNIGNNPLKTFSIYAPSAY